MGSQEKKSKIDGAMKTVENIMPILFRENNILVNKAGDITICYRYEGYEYLSKTAEDFRLATRRIAEAISFLPDNSVFHKQDIYIKDMMRTGYSMEKDFLSRAYLKLYDRSVYWKNLSYIYITLANGLTAHRNYSYPRFDNTGPQKEINPALHDKINNFLNAAKGFRQFMNDANLKLIPLSESETDAIINSYFMVYDNDFVGDIDFKNQLIGFNKFNIVSVSDGDQLPLEVSDARENPEYSIYSDLMADEKGNRKIALQSDYLFSLGYGLKVPHIINQIIFNDGKQHWNSELTKKRKCFNTWKMFDQNNAIMEKALEGFIKDTLEKNERVVRFHWNMIFWDNQHNSGVVEEVRSKLKEIGFIGRACNGLDVRHLYLASCPGNAATMPFENTFISQSTPVSALILKEKVYHKEFTIEEKGLLFTDRNNDTLIKRDCWFKPYETKQISNRNWIGIGKSGSGKSSMTIEIVRQYLSYNFNVSVLDIGRSFEVLGRVYDANRITYEEGMQLGINPYSFEGDLISNSQLEFLASFTAVLWRPNSILNDDEINALERIILAAYGGERDKALPTGFRVDGNYSNSSITHLYNFVQNNKNLVEELTKKKTEFFDRDSFLLAIDKFVEGKFDRLLSGKTLVDTNKNLTIWELDNIKDHPVLFPIVSTLITYLTTEVIWKKKDQEKIVLIEEAWKMLEKPVMATYIKWLYKTIRKFDGGVGLNIQQITDLNVENKSIRDTVLANSDVRFIMSHTPDMAKKLAQEIDLTDYQLALLLSIPLNEEKTKGAKFTELLSFVGSDCKALRLRVSKEQIINFMSEMKEKEKLFELVRNNNNNWETAIGQMANSY